MNSTLESVSERDVRCVDCLRSIYPGCQRCGRCERNRRRAPWLLAGAIALGLLAAVGIGVMAQSMIVSDTVSRGLTKVIVIVGAVSFGTVGTLLKAYRDALPKAAV